MTLQLAGPLAQRGDTPLGNACAIDRTMQMIGNRTAILLVREAFYGTTRFDRLVKRVGVTEAVAAQRLRELVDVGVLTKEPYQEPGQRTRYEYKLTESGHALLPTLLAMLNWGETYHHASRRRPTHAVHADCGADIHTVLRCDAGHDVGEEDVVITTYLPPKEGK